jgi:peptidoglycan/LPS O-acetylase OafA/YrhL
MMGAMLADWVLKDNKTDIAKFHIPVSTNALRLLLVLVCAICVEIRPHQGIYFRFLILAFGAIFFVWLLNEISRRTLFSIPLLEKAGKGSYSIYLVHMLWLLLIQHFLLDNPKLATQALRPLRQMLDTRTLHGWIIQISIILFGCWIFYLLVEKPFHGWARSFGRSDANRE